MSHPKDAIFRCSGTSRKTRIETSRMQDQDQESGSVAVELPEKQGLKRNIEI